VRLVHDTNVVLSGLLWTGSPMRILAAAQAGEAELESELKAVRAELREAGARGP
jgi:predicted nucleic acid-binding protein